MYKLLPQLNSQISDFPISSQQAAASATTIPGAQCLREAVFAGDSFWALEAAFGGVDGVIKTATGYCGGTLRKPTYREVCEGRTGHTEAVKVIYDNKKISYKSLCDCFWEIHDPTNKDYLKFGIGTQYHRSAIFYTNEEERKHAQESKIRRQMKLNRRIVTKIMVDTEFFVAENQHQKYHLQEKYKICETLGLRSTKQFVESNIACKLNGILAMEGKLIIDKLTTLQKTHDLTKQMKSALEEIIVEIAKKEEDFENPRAVEAAESIN